MYRVQRAVFAGAAIACTAALVVAALTNPAYYSSQAGVSSAIAANAGQGDLVDHTHLVALLIAAYLLPATFVAMAWTANRQSPWLGRIGLALALIGFLQVPVYVAQDPLFYDIARFSQFVTLAERGNQDGVMNFYGIAFGLGSVFGPTVLAIALMRARSGNRPTPTNRPGQQRRPRTGITRSSMSQVPSVAKR